MSTNNTNFWKLIQFFNNIEVVEKVVEEDKESGILCVKVTYKLKNEGKEYTTANLYYKDISKVDDVKEEKKVSNFFGEPVYWLDIEEHEWPTSPDSLNEGERMKDHIDKIINEIFNNNNDFNFLSELYKNIEEITHEGRDALYGANLVTNNHWHDIVKLIKYFIEKRGDVDLKSDEAKEYFKRMVFRWQEDFDGEKRRVSLHPNFGERKMIYDLLKNIKNHYCPK